MVLWFVINALRSERVPPSRPCATRALRQGVDGVDRRGGLRALVALCLVLVLLHRVLADERAVLVELAVAAFAVVHQAVVAFLHVALQRCLAALQRLVVFVAAAKMCEKGKGVKNGSGVVRLRAKNQQEFGTLPPPISMG